MQLTHFTDLGLRVLMYLSHQDREQSVTISEIAERFDVSRNHLVKVVHFMSQQGWLKTTRGKGGGLALAYPLAHYRLGDTIQRLEGLQEVMDCEHPACVLQFDCQLKHVLDNALSRFLEELNRHTLADILPAQTRQAIVKLHLQHTPRTIASIFS